MINAFINWIYFLVCVYNIISIDREIFLIHLVSSIKYINNMCKIMKLQGL